MVWFSDRLLSGPVICSFTHAFICPEKRTTYSDKYYNAGNIFSPIQYMNIFKYSFQKDILPSVVKLTFSTMM